LVLLQCWRHLVSLISEVSDFPSPSYKEFLFFFLS
jgi:hypothetical protein